MLEIAIIGAGPAGLSAGINAIARGKTVRIFSSESNYLLRAEKVNNYLGLYDVNGRQMMEQFLSHARAMGVVPEKGKAANILPMGEYFLLNVDGEMVEAKTVILATGVSSAKEIPGERELLGRGVSYCATCDGMLYRGKSAVVWGLSPEAAKEANFLQEIGVSVTFVSASAFREGLAEQIPYLSGAVKQVSGKEKVEAVLVNGQELPADGLFILRNSIAPAALVEGLVLEEGYIKVNHKMETNVPGLYASGDCTGKPLQVSKAVGEGLIAAQMAAAYLDGHKS